MFLKRYIALVMAVAMMFGSVHSVFAAEGMDDSDTKVSTAVISGPQRVSDKSSGFQGVVYDSLYFGSYPQAEVLAEEIPEIEYINNKLQRRILQEGDIIVDEDLYGQLTNAEWENDITMIDGERYVRRRSGDATYVGHLDYSYNYHWVNDERYAYFKIEPIKWRVLSIKGTKALLLADKVLDNQKYNNENKRVTWENSTIREWLNNTFMNSAFTQSEKNAIVRTKITNEDNRIFEGKGGNATIDSIFLLAESDLYTNENESISYGGNAQSYGFALFCNTTDKARRCKSTTYAKAMGANVDSGYTNPGEEEFAGNASWWIRTPGLDNTEALLVRSKGTIMHDFGMEVGHDAGDGVRPALMIDLSNTDIWSYAGTISAKHIHEYLSKMTLATMTKDGRVDKACWVCGRIKTSSAIPSIQTIVLDGKELVYNGNNKWPSVSIADRNGNRISREYYKVVHSAKCAAPGEYTLKVKFKGKYAGEKTFHYKILPKGTLISSLTASSKGFTVKWKKLAIQTTGYQIRYSTSSRMTNAKIVTVSGNTTVSKRIRKLKANKRYYVQVRTYKKVGTRKFYSSWSVKKYVTTKR